jgi:hypothetical protein
MRFRTQATRRTKHSALETLLIATGERCDLAAEVIITLG